MHTLTVITILLIFSATINAYAQITSSAVVDKPNNGQLKRMVMMQWNDWQPNPGSNWLGLPKNVQGNLYWRVLHRRYYKGSDLRPWKPGGPFPQNYASLVLQYEEDKKIRDHSKSIYQTNLSTMLNMSGGDLDLPYQLFFRKKFAGIYEALQKDLTCIALHKPKLLNELQQKEGFKDLMEWFDEAKDRINGIHKSFVDKGVRIEAYLDILNELRNKSAVFAAYLQMHFFLNSLPSTTEINKSGAQYDPKTDKQIVKEILKKFRE